MFTGKITNKETLPTGQLQITVEFSDGVDTETRTVVPQDKHGFEHWVTQVAQSLTTAKELKEEDNLGKVVEITQTQPTQEELDQKAWLKAYYNLQQLQKVADLNFLTGSRLTALNTKIANAKSFLDANVKASYLDLI